MINTVGLLIVVLSLFLFKIFFDEYKFYMAGYISSVFMMILELIVCIGCLFFGLFLLMANQSDFVVCYSIVNLFGICGFC